MRFIFILICLCFSSLLLAKNPTIILETSQGLIELELYQDKAPETVRNFLNYVDQKFYDGTIFHRVINNFMIQGGGYNDKMQEKKTRLPIKNEAGNGLKNEIGTISMARSSDPHSATSQFFINVAENHFLNHSSPTPSGWGYAVFGKVINGIHVVNRIKIVKTGNVNGFSDVPMDLIIIKTIRRKK
jgi:peptidyl-prolyl cis-trans isomerase B (cyclophilin B)